MPTTVTVKKGKTKNASGTATISVKPKRQRKRWVPDLKRYSAYRSSRSIYVPFDVPDGQADEYSGRYSDPESVVYSVCVALSRMFGFSMNLISAEMKAFMLKVVTERTPHLCCSSLRAVMEGRIPGIPKPTSHNPVKNHYARTTMMMMDVMDTIVCEYLREQEEGLSLLDGEVSDLGGITEISPEEQREILKPPFPTIAEQLERKERESLRVPSPEEVYQAQTLDREEADAIEDEETEEVHGSGVSQSEVPEESEDTKEGSV